MVTHGATLWMLLDCAMFSRPLRCFLLPNLLNQSMAQGN